MVPRLLGLALVVASVLPPAAPAATVSGSWRSDTSGVAIGCTLTEGARHRVTGACELDPLLGSAGGVYPVAGSEHAGVVRFAGTRSDHLRLRASARVTPSRLVVRFRVAGPATHFGGHGALRPVDDGDSYAHWLYAGSCSSCHGADARGAGGHPSVRCNDDPVSAIRSGSPAGMPAFSVAQLDDGSAAAIANWLAAQCAGDPPDALASDLYAGNCARCHGPSAEGGLYGTIRVPSVRCRSTDLLLAEMASGDGVMPAFPQLTATAQDAIVDWVRARCPSP